jgi:hypothetical protein
VRDVRFEDCLIWGRSSMSLLVRNQDFRFERCRIVGYMVANGSGLPPLSILFSRCEITDEPTPAFAPGYLIDVAEGGSGVGVDRCTITTARQHIGNLSDAKVTRTRFVAEVRTEALDENWLVLLYRGHVQDCTFHDALPSSGGGPITVNYGLNTSWEGMKLGEEGQPAHTLLLGQLGWCQLDRAILRVQLGALCVAVAQLAQSGRRRCVRGVSYVQKLSSSVTGCAAGLCSSLCSRRAVVLTALPLDAPEPRRLPTTTPFSAGSPPGPRAPLAARRARAPRSLSRATRSAY